MQSQNFAKVRKDQFWSYAEQYCDSYRRQSYVLGIPNVRGSVLNNCRRFMQELVEQTFETVKLCIESREGVETKLDMLKVGEGYPKCQKAKNVLTYLALMFAFEPEENMNSWHSIDELFSQNLKKLSSVASVFLAAPERLNRLSAAERKRLKSRAALIAGRYIEYFAVCFREVYNSHYNSCLEEPIMDPNGSATGHYRRTPGTEI